MKVPQPWSCTLRDHASSRNFKALQLDQFLDHLLNMGGGYTSTPVATPVGEIQMKC